MDCNLVTMLSRPTGASPTLNNSTSALLPAAYTPGLLHDYRHMVAQTKPKQLPSGADIVAQMCGGYTLFQAHSAVTSGPKFATMQWPSSLAWLIIQTGHTMSTDQALSQFASVGAIGGTEPSFAGLIAS